MRHIDIKPINNMGRTVGTETQQEVNHRFQIVILFCFILYSDLLSNPVDSQIFPRDQVTGKCTVTYQTNLGTAQLKVYANGSLQETITETTNGTLTAVIDADLVNYKFELVNGNSIIESADNIACGDAYIIYGQSNAEAGYGAGNYTYRNEFIRTYQGSWVQATSNGGRIGVWGLHLARQIIEKHEVPVVIINGAKGNTAIQHLVRDAVYDPVDEQNWINETNQWGNFYKRMLAWVEEAGLLSDIRLMLWHQGERQAYHDAENTSKYYQEFLDLRKELYEDYPSLENIIMFQVRPGCGGYGDMDWSIMHEQQRKLAVDFPDVQTVSTLSYGVAGCHYGEQQLEGYQIIAEDLFPLIDTTYYGATYSESISSPNILQVAWTSSSKDEIVMQFDQPVKWNAELVEDPHEYSHEFFQSECRGTLPTYLNQTFSFDSVHQASNQVVSGRAEGNLVYLELNGSQSYTKLAYPSPMLNGCWAGPYITRLDSAAGALGFYVDIKDELDSLPVAVSNSPAIPMWSQNPEGITFSVEYPIDHVVQLWDIRGNRLNVLNRRGNREYRLLKSDLQAGVYIIRILIKGRETSRSLLVY